MRLLTEPLKGSIMDLADCSLYHQNDYSRAVHQLRWILNSCSVHDVFIIIFYYYILPSLFSSDRICLDRIRSSLPGG